MSALALAWRQYRFERRIFWRSPTAAFFNLLLPLAFLVMVAAVIADRPGELEALVPGVAGFAIVTTTFTALAFNLTFLREQGILKRVRGLPTPRSAYVGGLLASKATNALSQVVLVVAIGHLAYGVTWPRDPVALAAYTVLGVACFGALGVAFSHAIPNFDSAAAYVNAVFLPTIFVSGVFYASSALPRPLEVIAEVLPLKHVIDGLGAALVGGPAEPTGLAVIAAWTLGGVVLAARGFRWE